MEKKLEWVTIISDNGGHYHNADLMMILKYWPDWYGIWPKKWIFLEPGEAKTTIDSHHAQVCCLNLSIELHDVGLLHVQNRLHIPSIDA